MGNGVVGTQLKSLEDIFLYGVVKAFSCFNLQMTLEISPFYVGLSRKWIQLQSLVDQWLSALQ